MCQKPIRLHRAKSRKTDAKFQNVPCGQCPECRKATLSGWLFRLNQELLRSPTAHFVTLTYNRENLPKVEFEHLDTETGELTYEKTNIPTLRKKDVQDYFKRLRYALSKKTSEKIKYMLVGEYGSKRGRPHYHAIIFNCQIPELIESEWGNGFVYYPPLDVSRGGMAYVLKYISKRDHNYTFGQTPLFTLTSNGIGDNYITDSSRRFHLDCVENCFLTLVGGQKLKMNRYYKNKIYNPIHYAWVTEYLQQRAENAEIQTLKEMRKKYPRKSDEFLLRRLELSKIKISFDRKFSTDEQ